MSETEVTTTIPDPTTAEAYPEAAALLQAAGWKPHDGWNVYTRDTLVMGFQPDGQAFHVKNWAAIQEGHPQWTSDTPDTAEEAAAWLVERFKPNPLTTEATLDPVALQSEEVENPGDESNGETGASPDGGEQLLGADAPEGSDVDDGAGVGISGEGAEVFGSVDFGDADGSNDAELPTNFSGSIEAAGGVDFDTGAVDADFTEGEDLGSELLDAHDTILEGGDPWSTPELPAPDPIDFAPDEIAPEPENDQARFYGLDDLDRVRSLRIGDVATEALRLTTMIEQIVSEQEGEFATIQAYVVS
ncbi:MAG: hypothetical protein ABL932_14335, partial [Terricaulis sp.]